MEFDRRNTEIPVLNDLDYVIKRRHIRKDLDDATIGAEYLGRDGRWYARISQARIFNSLPAVEAALQETWSRLRNTGERSVILSVAKLSSTNG